MGVSCKEECPKYYPLGCIAHCRVIVLPLAAPEDGLYTLIYNIAGIKFQDHLSLMEGDKIYFDSSCLNECKNTTLEIIDSKGNIVFYEEGDCTYEGFEFTTQIIYTK